MPGILDRYRKVSGTGPNSTIRLDDWNGLLDELSATLDALIKKGVAFDAIATVAIGVLLDRINEVLSPAYDHVLDRQAEADAAVARLTGSGVAAAAVLESADRFFLTPALRDAIESHGAALAAITGGADPLLDTFAEVAGRLVADGNQLALLLAADAVRLRFDAAQALSDAQFAQLVANARLPERFALLDGSNVGPTGFRNRLVNGDLSVWQRGLSFSNPESGTALADMTRFLANGTGGTYTFSRAASAGDRVGGIRYQQTVAETGGSYRVVACYVEGARSLAGKRVAISFEAFRAAGQPDRSLSYSVYQTFGTGGSPSSRAVVVSQAALSPTVTDTPARFSIVAEIPTTAGKTFGTNNDDAFVFEIGMPRNVTWDVTIRDLQIEEIGSASNSATPFERVGAALNLLRCQRYYRKTYDPDVAPGTVTSAGMISNTVEATTNFALLAAWRFDPPMRDVPNVTAYNPSTGGTANPIRNLNASTDLPVQFGYPGRSGVRVAVNSASVAAGNAVGVHLVADASL